MEVLRFLQNGRWRNLYYGMLKNRLRRDLNLKDISSVSDALENLGLTGDVETHNHDTRYKKMIEQAKGEMRRAIKGASEDYDSINKRVVSLETDIDILNQNAIQKPHFWVGKVFPKSPKDNDVWFNTKDNLIMYFLGGKWNAFTAGWKD